MHGNYQQMSVSFKIFSSKDVSQICSVINDHINIRRMPGVKA